MNVSLTKTQISIGGVERVKKENGSEKRQLQLWDRTKNNIGDVKLTKEYFYCAEN